MHKLKNNFIFGILLASICYCWLPFRRAESFPIENNTQLAQGIKSEFKNYWDRFEIYPGRLKSDRALVIADGGYMAFEEKIQCPSGDKVWIHTPTEPHVVLDVVETTKVSIESTNYTNGLIVIVADEDFNILSCDKGAIPGVQINAMTLRTGTYGVWYGIRDGYQASRFMHSKLWIVNE